MSGVHSLLAPSAASRWARCSGSLLLSKGYFNKATKDAASGTCTHWLAEQYAKGGMEAAILDQWIGKELQFDGFDFIVDADRVARARTYVENVAREPGTRYIEHRLDTSPILGIPGQEGHADTVTVDPHSLVLIDGVEHKGVISVHDLKDGAGHIVWAKNNLQGLIYGAAALYEFDMVAPFNAIRFCIHQPRVNHYDEWTYSRVEIEHFISIIRPAAKLAYDLFHGNVDFAPAAHLNPGEEQCMWCPARGSCPARAQRIVDMFETIAVKHEIDDATLAGIYVKLDELESACKDFREEAYRRALSGRKINGFKLVNGNRGKRYWKDKAKAKRVLEMIVPEEQLYEPREIVSPTEIERVVGKKAYKGMSVFKDLVDQAQGAPTLVPESDKRDEITPTQFEVLK